MQDMEDGADVQQVHQGTSLIVLAAMRDMDDVCVAMAQRVQSISIAPKKKKTRHGLCCWVVQSV
jgi:hypothetical protein